MNRYSLVTLMTMFSQSQVYWLTVGREGAKDPSLLLCELNTRLPSPIPNLSPHPRQATIELAKRYVP